MRFRKLGRTGFDVSVIGLGSWQFSDEWGHRFTQGEVDALLGRAGELGINLVDTAECYGDHLAEERIGRAIAGRREEWIVATKFGHRFHADRVGGERWWPQDAREECWSPAQVVEQLDRSLRALGTDYIDVYQFHSGGIDEFETDGLWAALRGERAKGKIRALGISLRGPRADPTGASGVLAERADDVGADVIQLLYNRLERSAELYVLPACTARNLGVLAREPLANGLLGGRYAPGRWVQNAEDWRRQLDPDVVEARLAEAVEIQRHEVPDGVPVARWALAWCLQNPAVAAVIPGCKTLDQLEGNASAADLRLNPATPPALA